MSTTSMPATPTTASGVDTSLEQKEVKQKEKVEPKSASTSSASAATAPIKENEEKEEKEKKQMFTAKIGQGVSSILGGVTSFFGLSSPAKPTEQTNVPASAVATAAEASATPISSRATETDDFYARISQDGFDDSYISEVRCFVEYFKLDLNGYLPSFSAKPEGLIEAYTNSLTKNSHPDKESYSNREFSLLFFQTLALIYRTSSKKVSGKANEIESFLKHAVQESVNDYPGMIYLRFLSPLTITNVKMLKLETKAEESWMEALKNWMASDLEGILSRVSDKIGTVTNRIQLELMEIITGLTTTEIDFITIKEPGVFPLLFQLGIKSQVPQRSATEAEARFKDFTGNQYANLIIDLVVKEIQLNSLLDKSTKPAEYRQLYINRMLSKEQIEQTILAHSLFLVAGFDNMAYVQMVCMPKLKPTQGFVTDKEIDYFHSYILDILNNKMQRIPYLFSDDLQKVMTQQIERLNSLAYKKELGSIYNKEVKGSSSATGAATGAFFKPIEASSVTPATTPATAPAGRPVITPATAPTTPVANLLSHLLPTSTPASKPAITPSTTPTTPASKPATTPSTAPTAPAGSLLSHLLPPYAPAVATPSTISSSVAAAQPAFGSAPAPAGGAPATTGPPVGGPPAAAFGAPVGGAAKTATGAGTFGAPADVLGTRAFGSPAETAPIGAFGTGPVGTGASSEFTFGTPGGSLGAYGAIQAPGSGAFGTATAGGAATVFGPPPGATPIAALEPKGTGVGVAPSATFLYDKLLALGFPPMDLVGIQQFVAVFKLKKMNVYLPAYNDAERNLMKELRDKFNRKYGTSTSFSFIEIHKYIVRMLALIVIRFLIERPDTVVPLGQIESRIEKVVMTDKKSELFNGWKELKTLILYTSRSIESYSGTHVNEKPGVIFTRSIDVFFDVAIEGLANFIHKVNAQIAKKTTTIVFTVNDYVFVVDDQFENKALRYSPRFMEMRFDSLKKSTIDSITVKLKRFSVSQLTGIFVRSIIQEIQLQCLLENSAKISGDDLELADYLPAHIDDYTIIKAIAHYTDIIPRVKSSSNVLKIRAIFSMAAYKEDTTVNENENVMKYIALKLDDIPGNLEIDYTSEFSTAVAAEVEKILTKDSQPKKIDFIALEELGGSISAASIALANKFIEIFKLDAIRGYLPKSYTDPGDFIGSEFSSLSELYLTKEAFSYVDKQKAIVTIIALIYRLDANGRITPHLPLHATTNSLEILFSIRKAWGNRYRALDELTYYAKGPTLYDDESLSFDKDFADLGRWANTFMDSSDTGVVEFMKVIENISGEFLEEINSLFKGNKEDYSREYVFVTHDEFEPTAFRYLPNAIARIVSIGDNDQKIKQVAHDITELSPLQLAQLFITSVTHELQLTHMVTKASCNIEAFPLKERPFIKSTTYLITPDDIGAAIRSYKYIDMIKGDNPITLQCRAVFTMGNIREEENVYRKSDKMDYILDQVTRLGGFSVDYSPSFSEEYNKIQRMLATQLRDKIAPSSSGVAANTKTPKLTLEKFKESYVNHGFTTHDIAEVLVFLERFRINQDLGSPYDISASSLATSTETDLVGIIEKDVELILAEDKGKDNVEKYNCKKLTELILLTFAFFYHRHCIDMELRLDAKSETVEWLRYTITKDHEKIKWNTRAILFLFDLDIEPITKPSHTPDIQELIIFKWLDSTFAEIYLGNVLKVVQAVMEQERNVFTMAKHIFTDFNLIEIEIGFVYSVKYEQKAFLRVSTYFREHFDPDTRADTRADTRESAKKKLAKFQPRMLCNILTFVAYHEMMMWVFWTETFSELRNATIKTFGQLLEKHKDSPAWKALWIVYQHSQFPAPDPSIKISDDVESKFTSYTKLQKNMYKQDYKGPLNLNYLTGKVKTELSDQGIFNRGTPFPALYLLKEHGLFRTTYFTDVKTLESSKSSPLLILTETEESSPASISSSVSLSGTTFESKINKPYFPEISHEAIENRYPWGYTTQSTGRGTSIIEAFGPVLDPYAYHLTGSFESRPPINMKHFYDEAQKVKKQGLLPRQQRQVGSYEESEIEEPESEETPREEEKINEEEGSVQEIKEESDSDYFSEGEGEEEEGDEEEGDEEEGDEEEGDEGEGDEEEGEEALEIKAENPAGASLPGANTLTAPNADAPIYRTKRDQSLIHPKTKGSGEILKNVDFRLARQDHHSFLRKRKPDPALLQATHGPSGNRRRQTPSVTKFSPIPYEAEEGFLFTPTHSPASKRRQQSHSASSRNKTAKAKNLNESESGSRETEKKTLVSTAKAPFFKIRAPGLWSPSSVPAEAPNPVLPVITNPLTSTQSTTVDMSRPVKPRTTASASAARPKASSSTVASAPERTKKQVDLEALQRQFTSLTTAAPVGRKVSQAKTRQNRIKYHAGLPTGPVMQFRGSKIQLANLKWFSKKVNGNPWLTTRISLTDRSLFTLVQQSGTGIDMDNFNSALFVVVGGFFKVNVDGAPGVDVCLEPLDFCVEAFANGFDTANIQSVAEPSVKLLQGHAHELSKAHDKILSQIKNATILKGGFRGFHDSVKRDGKLVPTPVAIVVEKMKPEEQDEIGYKVMQKKTKTQPGSFVLFVDDPEDKTADPEKLADKLWNILPLEGYKYSLPRIKFGRQFSLRLSVAGNSIPTNRVSITLDLTYALPSAKKVTDEDEEEIEEGGGGDSEEEKEFEFADEADSDEEEEEEAAEEVSMKRSSSQKKKALKFATGDWNG